MPEGQNLKSLGSNTTEYKFEAPNADMLETFENKYPDSPYGVEFETEEFTSLCPKTGQPDFATIQIRYVPAELCIESKSLKLYLFSYRNHGSFMETITNKIARDIFDTCDPHALLVTGTFKARGGIDISVQVPMGKAAEML